MSKQDGVNGKSVSIFVLEAGKSPIEQRVSCHLFAIVHSCLNQIAEHYQ